MALARAYKESGLVVPPPGLTCVGEVCPIAAAEGSCYDSDHHLYFPRDVYEQDELTLRFRENDFNMVTLPRCMHTLYHRQVTAALPPSEEIMELFLEQAAILEELGVKAKDVAKEIKRLNEVYPGRGWVRIEYSKYDRSYFERIKSEKMHALIAIAKRALDESMIIPVRQITETHVVGAAALRPILDLPVARGELLVV